MNGAHPRTIGDRGGHVKELRSGDKYLDGRRQTGYRVVVKSCKGLSSCKEGIEGGWFKEIVGKFSEGTGGHDEGERNWLSIMGSIIGLAIVGGRNIDVDVEYLGVVDVGLARKHGGGMWTLLRRKAVKWKIGVSVVRGSGVDCILVGRESGNVSCREERVGDTKGIERVGGDGDEGFVGEVGMDVTFTRVKGRERRESIFGQVFTLLLGSLSGYMIMGKGCDKGAERMVIAYWSGTIE
ncbi:hypothetical protein Tco_0403465 [Tanacetum coccineum]